MADPIELIGHNDGLAPATVAHLHAFLHRALGQAHRWGLIAQNIAALVKPPRIPKRQLRTLNSDEVQRLLGAVEGDRLEALYALALTTGMRLGELLALRSADVDLPQRRVSVRGSLARGEEGFKVSENENRARTPRAPHDRRV